MEDSQIPSKLKSIIEALGLSDSQFADTCGISRSTLSLLLSGKNKKISDVMLSQIHQAFPQVSILWLLFGEGEMLKNLNPTPESRNYPSENSLFPEEGKEVDEQLNLVNLKQLENVVQKVVNKSFEASYPSLEKIVLKTQEIPAPRKVSKITVYYDDSTFETFIPE